MKNYSVSSAPAADGSEAADGRLGLLQIITFDHALAGAAFELFLLGHVKQSVTRAPGIRCRSSFFAIASLLASALGAVAADQPADQTQVTEAVRSFFAAAT